MSMNQCIRIGNQTAIACAERLAPFEFALSHGFDAFEWFADKKVHRDGTVSGWDESDMDPAMRAWIRETGEAAGVRFTVHAPWQANPLHPGGVELLFRSLEFAREIGADLVNLHLYMDEGSTSYVRSLTAVIRRAARDGLRLSIENTPETTPADFNHTFARLAELAVAPPGTVGMCLDIGHANLCAETHNDYLRYLDALAPEVPLIHLHVHENYGDADRHLTLFTGPAGEDDSAVRGLLRRLRRRTYEGAMILEQWPHPPELLVEAATRLRGLLNGTPSPGAGEGAAESPPAN
jgi:sugar phosphate isomerase/epimerase